MNVAWLSRRTQDLHNAGSIPTEKSTTPRGSPCCAPPLDAKCRNSPVTTQETREGGSRQYVPGEGQKGWHVVLHIPDDGLPGNVVERVFGVEGNEPVADLVMQPSLQGHFLDWSADGNVELSYLKEELLEKGAMLLAPSRNVNAADRATDGDRPLLRSCDAEPWNGVQVQRLGLEDFRQAVRGRPQICMSVRQAVVPGGHGKY